MQQQTEHSFEIPGETLPHNDALEKLVEPLHPERMPDDYVRDRWQDRTGFVPPQDYLLLLARYGTGTFYDLISICEIDSQFFEEEQRFHATIMNAYDEDGTLFELFGAEKDVIRHELFLWSTTSNGDLMFWRDPKRGNFTTIIIDRDGEPMETIDYSVTDLLVRAASATTGSEIIDDAIFGPRTFQPPVDLNGRDSEQR